MDYYQQNNRQPYIRPERNTMATASLILGVASLVMLCTGILPIPLGALGVLLAVLSRRGGRMPQPGGLGCALSCAGMAGGLFLTLAVYITMLIGMIGSIDPSDLQNMDRSDLMNQMMESLYGSEYKELFRQYGIDYDALMDQMN
ncbi:MAG: cytochrome d ubiquinol oxidase subunit II [Lachnospiraceae bacterium]|nr:cytochrome d ubiquinol oxidase subunit II [Lachnospiraceae bacterium]